MCSLDVLNDVAQVFAGPVQVLLRSSGRQPSCGVRDEIGEIPTLDVGAEPYDPRVLFELPQGRNAEPAGIVQLNLQRRGSLLCFREIAGPDAARSIFQAQKGVRPPIYLS